ncbi:MAG: SDR family NAD(P)-dependent oxidoreductase, partial [Myxococcota bacterium]
MLAVRQAFHSPRIEAAMGGLATATCAIAMGQPTIPIISNVTGTYHDEQTIRPGYWVEQMRAPVRFDQGITTLCDVPTCFVEIGPGAALLSHIRACVDDSPHSAVASLAGAQSTRDPRNELSAMMDAVAQLYICGVEPSWSRLYLRSEYGVATLPSYPFERKSYWCDPPRAAFPDIPRLPGRPVFHPACPDRPMFELPLSLAMQPYLAGHRVAGQVLLPASAYTALAGALWRQLGGHSGGYSIRELRIVRALPISEAPVTVQSVVSGDRTRGLDITVYHQQVSDGQPTWHQLATMTVQGPTESSSDESGPTLAETPDQTAAARALYERMDRRGVSYNGGFRCLQSIAVRDGRAVAKLVNATDGGPEETLIAVLDGACQVVAPLLPGSELALLQTGAARIEVMGEPPRELWCVAGLQPATHGAGFLCDVTARRTDGSIYARFTGIRIEPAPGLDRWSADNELARDTWHDYLYQLDWQSSSLPPRLVPSALDEKDIQLVPGTREVAHDWDGVLPAMEAVAAGYARQALHALGIPSGASELDGRAVGVSEQHRALLQYLIRYLASAAVPSSDNPAAAIGQLRQRYPEVATELTMLERCGSRLADVMRGEIDGVTLLFDASQEVTAGDLYRNALGMYRANQRVAACLRQLLGTVRGRPRIRILEIGGGTGSTTTQVLTALAALDLQASVAYCFTDVSPGFRATLDALDTDAATIEFRVLDIAADPLAQGFEPESYDLIIAGNVLHATPDVERTTAHVTQLLAPGGMVIAIEGTQGRLWSDLIMGLTPGWWCFADAYRDGHALMADERWLQVFKAHGLIEVRAVRDDHPAWALASSPVVLMGQRPPTSHTARICLAFCDSAEQAEQLRRQLGPATRVIPVLAGAQPSWTSARDATAGTGVAVVRPQYRQDFDELLARMLDSAGPAVTIWYGWGLGDRLDSYSGTSRAEISETEGERLSRSLRRAVAGLLHLVQALSAVQEHSTASTRLPIDGLAVVVREALGPGAATASHRGLIGAAVAGLTRVIQKEHLELNPTIIDLGNAAGAELMGEALDICLQDSPGELVWHETEWLVPRIVRTVPRQPETAIDPDGVYLIAGGLGGLGSHLARALLDGGARKLLLCGRSELTAERGHLLDEMSQRYSDATVDYRAIDIGAPESVAELCENIRPDRLAGIIHCAGVFDDRMLHEHDWSLFDKLFHAKVLGTWHLAQVAERCEAKLLCLASSISAVLGGAGMGNYIAANSFVDRFA